MTKEDLIASAAHLQPFTSEAAADYGEKRLALVSAVNSGIAGRKDVDALIGADNMDMMKDNHANHALFIESMLTTFDPTVLVETILWVFRAYKSRNFHDTYWAAQLNSWVDAIEGSCSKQNAENILPLYNWMTVNIPQFTALSQE